MSDIRDGVDFSAGASPPWILGLFELVRVSFCARLEIYA